MKKKNNYKRIIILLIIFIILSAIIIVLVNGKKASLEKYKNIYSYILDDNSWEDGSVYPDNMPVFKRTYQGELATKSVGKSIIFVINEEIPKLKKTFKGKDNNYIEKYFKKNEEVIKLILGMQTSAEFTSFINSINKLEVDKIEFESYHIDTDSIITGEEGTSFNLHVKYKNCTELIFKITVKNQKDYDNASIIWSM